MTDGLCWPDLDVDLTPEIIENPGRFPLTRGENSLARKIKFVGIQDCSYVILVKVLHFQRLHQGIFGLKECEVIDVVII